jgi:hypothetical protein
MPGVSLFFAPENVLFSVALLVMLVLAALEALGVILGGGISHAVDAMLPGLDADADVGHGGVLGWLHLGKVPLLILLIILLTVFGVIGLALQAVTRAMFGFYWPGLAAAVPSVALALPAVRAAGALYLKLAPRDETTAVSEEALIGRVAVITLGEARKGAPAEGRLRDQHGQTHYVMVEPDVEGEGFPAGTEVLLVTRAGAKFFGIRNPSAALSDTPR